MEARPKIGTVFKIKIPTQKLVTSHTNRIKQKKRVKRINPFLALTVEEATITIESDETSTIGRLNRKQVMRDLKAVSPSASTETILRDESTEGEQEQQNIQPVKIYGIIKTSTDFLKKVLSLCIKL